MDIEELGAWLRLIEAPHIGAVTARQLLRVCGSPQDVFEPAQRATVRELLSQRERIEFWQPREGFEQRLDQLQTWLQGGEQRAVLSLGDTHYPQSLLQTSDPPLLLYVQGDPASLNHAALAIVGSRHATPQGLDHARSFAAYFAQAQWLVVSGLAQGIDGAAHEGALSQEHGPGTIAVVGTGLDRVYPASHRDLAHRIARHGALISEYPLGTPPLAANFPRRNRLIAGLSRGSLVVEAAVQSGSLITARLAADLGREVFAIPGSIHSPQSRGCHALIKQGAKLVETAQDVLEELGCVAAPATAKTTPSEQENPGDHPILQVMGYDPIGLDEIANRTGWPTAQLQAQLLDLELAGQVARLPGQRFQRRAQA